MHVGGASGEAKVHETPLVCKGRVSTDGTNLAHRCLLPLAEGIRADICARWGVVVAPSMHTRLGLVNGENEGLVKDGVFPQQ